VFFWCQDWLSFKRLRTPVERREGLLQPIRPARVTVRKRACPYEPFLLSELLPVDIAQPINRNSPTVVDHDNRRLGVSHLGQPIIHRKDEDMSKLIESDE
jgi:hypothetical protein